MSSPGHSRKKSFASDSNAESKSITSSNNEYEVDSMGILHHIQSNSSIVNALPSSYIDHRNYTNPNSINTRNKNPTNNRRLPKPESPTQLTSPSLAERWMKRHSNASVPQHSQLPLTNNNLSHLNQFNPNRDPKYGSIKIDMDKFIKDNNMLPPDTSEQPHFRDPFAESDNRSINSYEFGSNPSEDSDGSTSLDDVCFPMEYEDESTRVWPDLKILDEFCMEEIAELKQRASEDMEVSAHVNSQESSQRSDQVMFQTPISKPVEDSRTPLLGHTKVNEAEIGSGRLRPTRPVPWSSTNQEFKTILNPTPNQDNEKFRFIYFREDLDQTIHSPNISGLLQPDQSFKDLFMASHYTKTNEGLSLQHSRSQSILNANANLHQSSPSPVSNTNGTPVPATLGVGPPQNPQTAKFHQTHNTNSVKNTPVDTPTPSLAGAPPGPKPFWLDVLNPTEEEMKVLSKAFGIHPLTTEDIFLGETREKVELFKDYYFICFRSFDIVYERRKQKKIELERLQKIQESIDHEHEHDNGFMNFIQKLNLWKNHNNKSSAKKLNNFVRSSSSVHIPTIKNESVKTKKLKRRTGELEPLNMYIIVFRDGVITFHFQETPHPMNVRRRARLLRDYLNVSADWIGYALIDDITDAFGPMIESIQDEVNSIEDAILKMHSGDVSDSDSDSDDELEEEYIRPKLQTNHSSGGNIFRKRRSKSTVDNRSLRSFKSSSSSSSKTSKSRSTATNIIGWKRKGDMLRRIGECRKRVMSILRLLGSKADVIKGFAKRCNEQWEVAPRSEIGMYLGDIQDHIVTMVQSLNHYEKLLARFHSNYLAQINIDMTKVNNDMNDVLGKITILGTIVLPINVVTGLWGMNVEVPGQFVSGIAWFCSIVACMIMFSVFAYYYTKRVTGIS